MMLDLIGANELAAVTRFLADEAQRLADFNRWPFRIPELLTATRGHCIFRSPRVPIAPQKSSPTAAAATAIFGIFDTVVIESEGERDLFIAKYAPEGGIAWVAATGEAVRDVALGIAVDADGTIYTSGYFVGTADFGDRRLTSRGSGTDVCIVAYNSDGSVRRAICAGGLFDDAGTDVALDPAGDIHVTGFFHLTSDFGEDSLASAGVQDTFIWKIDDEALRLGISRIETESPVHRSDGQILALTPNPTHAGAEFVAEIEMSEAVRVRMVLVDLQGEQTSVVFEGDLAAGRTSLPIDTRELPAGIYHLLLDYRSGRIVQRLVIRR